MVPRTNHLDRIIREVVKVHDGYQLWVEESWGVFLPYLYGREPLAGDTVRIYFDTSKGVHGPCVRGLDLNGTRVFYRR